MACYSTYNCVIKVIGIKDVEFFMSNSPYETRLQEMMVVAFSVAKSWICFLEYNFHDSLQERLIEAIGYLNEN